MSDLIEQIKADRKAGTPGEWRSYQDGVHPSFHGPSPQTTNGDFAVCQCFGPDMMANQSRIARVPQLEQIAIDAAAEIQRLTEQNERLREALYALEGANDVVCSARTQDIYDQMVQSGQEDILITLDRARSAARAALKGGE
jgi:hypothetical protein